MQTLVGLLVGNTAVALALALVAWACGRWGRPALAHVVWVLVIVKLLTPPVWRVEVIQERAVEAAPVVVAANVASSSVDVRASAKPPFGSEPQGRRQAAERVPPAPIAIRVSAPAPGRSFDAVSIIPAVWITGSVVLLLLAAWRVIRFARVLRRATPADDALRKEVERLASRIGLYRLPRVLVVDEAISPMLWFVGGAPRLILPRMLLERMTAHQRGGMIAHELAHLKRRDHWVRLLELPATVLLWWHPLVWAARRGLREAEEQCCDAWAVSVVPDGRRLYADALVDALEMITRPVRLPAGATGLGQLGTLRRRLTMIVTQSPPKSVSLAGRALLAVLFVAIFIMPVRGQRRDTRKAANEAAPVAATMTTTAAVADDATRQAVRALLDAAQDRDQSVSQAAHQALAQFGASAVPVLIDSLSDPRTGPVATGLLARQGSAAVDALVAALQSRDSLVRGHALAAMEHMLGEGSSGFMDPSMMGMGMEGGPAMGAMIPSPQAPDIASRLIDPVSKAAQDAEPTVRRAAVQLLVKIAGVKPDEAIVAPLLAALKDEDMQVRSYAAHGLGRLGPMAAGAVEALAGAIGERDVSLRISALDALASMGPNAKGAMSAVVGALKAPEAQVRSAAARALGSMQAQRQPQPVPGQDPMWFDFPVGAPAAGQPAVPGGFAPAQAPTPAPAR
jgi:beta-lactamase regulating signal transducer with metallopeptidase domain/HEAT repeat protein